MSIVVAADVVMPHSKSQMDLHPLSQYSFAVSPGLLQQLLRVWSTRFRTGICAGYRPLCICVDLAETKSLVALEFSRIRCARSIHNGRTIVARMRPTTRLL